MDKNKIEENLMEIRRTICKCDSPCWQCKYAVWDKDSDFICAFEYIIDKMNIIEDYDTED